MSFPLFHRPGSIVLLDDDTDYLDLLAMVLPRHWHVRMFRRPVRCVHHMHREPRLWDEDRWQHQQMIELWRAGRPLIPQLLQYWARTPDRYALTHVCVVDFSMPGMDGLQVLSELVAWPGARILLTGQADERVAVGAFNRRLIDHYIPKQAADVAQRLVEAIASLFDRAHQHHDAIWRSTLRPEQLALLAAPGVEASLRAVADRHWVDYVTLGQPFGMLGLDASGQVSWLQLETSERLTAIAELATLQGMDRAGLEAIRAGRRLASPELRQALAQPGCGEPVPAFAPAGAGTPLLAALHPLPASVLPAPIAGHQQWLSRQAPRGISD